MTTKKTNTRKRWKPTIGAPLGPQERTIIDALDGKASCSIFYLYRTVMRMPIAKATVIETRVMQQKIGGIVSRLNKKLKGRRVVTGEAGTATYRLRRVR